MTSFYCVKYDIYRLHYLYIDTCACVCVRARSRPLVLQVIIQVIVYFRRLFKSFTNIELIKIFIIRFHDINTEADFSFNLFSA